MSGMRPCTQNPRLVVVPRQAIPGAIRLIRGILKHQKWRDGETLVSRVVEQKNARPDMPPEL